MAGNLGKFLRKLRIENDEYLKDMAEKTGVSISYLSSIENEAKKISSTMIEKIIEAYKLTDSQIEELKKYSIEANKEVSINVQSLDENKIDLAYQFARYIDRISPQTVEKLKEFLKEDVDD